MKRHFLFLIIFITSVLVLFFQNCTPFQAIDGGAGSTSSDLSNELENLADSQSEAIVSSDKSNDQDVADLSEIISPESVDLQKCTSQLNEIQNVGQLKAIPTFHSIGLYWTPSNRNNSKIVNVKFKQCGSTKWRNGLDMIYNPINGIVNSAQTGKRADREDFRGSVVNLQAGVTYIIQLTVAGNNETVQIASKTWDQKFKIKETINLRNQTFNNTLKYDSAFSGSKKDGYVLIDGTGSTIDASGKDLAIHISDAKYLILRGFTIINARQHSIKLHKSQFIVIENNDISRWGSREGSSNFGINNQAAIYTSRQGSSHNLVIQRNKFHNPNFGANNWTQLRASKMNKPASEIIYSDRHPNGPVAIYLSNNYIGNNVIRYNDFLSSDNTKYFNDVIGGDANDSYDGFPGSDSDIYGNYISSAWDDGIEVEGGNANVRIWDNYIEKTYIAIGNAAISIGPLYIWRNVSGESAQNHTSKPGFGYFLKMGYASSDKWMTGVNYVFNNTILQPSNLGYSGIGTTGGVGGRGMNATIIKNNILQVRPATAYSVSTRRSKIAIPNSYNFNLSNNTSGQPAQPNGIQGFPKYSHGTGTFDLNSKTGRFSQAPGSSAIDAGTIIANFADIFTGSKPDMGAFESSKMSQVYGRKAN